MTIGIRLKIVPSRLQQKCISVDFPQFLELPLLRTHIGGCFRRVRKASVCRIFPKYLFNIFIYIYIYIYLCIYIYI